MMSNLRFYSPSIICCIQYVQRFHDFWLEHYDAKLNGFEHKTMMQILLFFSVLEN